jgi:hypothetical protein
MKKLLLFLGFLSSINLQSAENIVSVFQEKVKVALCCSGIARPSTQHGQTRRFDREYDQWLQKRFKDQLETEEFKRLEAQVEQQIQRAKKTVIVRPSKMPIPVGYHTTKAKMPSVEKLFIDTLEDF